jgi:hypothetical protein
VVIRALLPQAVVVTKVQQVTKVVKVVRVHKDLLVELAQRALHPQAVVVTKDR